MQGGIHRLRGVVYLKVILTGISVVLVLVMVFVNIADYALYSTKRNLIARGIDYSVCAAIQEVDLYISRNGLSEGFDPESGKILVNDIRLNEQTAENAFWGTLAANTGVSIDDIGPNTLITYVWPTTAGISYLMKKETERNEGFVGSPNRLEQAINNAISTLWSAESPESDSHVIYVNGNPSTNEFKRMPYFLVFIKDYQIDGLFRKRTATFVGFAGAKLERRE